MSQLSQLVGSPVFSGSERLTRFLTFVVERSLAGETPQLKEHVIGTEVYARGASYDPRIDPIVRVEAGRLRSKLREYYETAGASDPVVIQIAKGSYIATFSRRHGGAPHCVPSRRSIAILPFVPLEPDQHHLCDGLTEELIHILARIPSLRVVARTSVFQFKNRREDVRTIGRLLDVATVVEGSVREGPQGYRVTANLIDTSDGCYIWTGAYDRPASDRMAVQGKLASAIASALRINLVDSLPSRTHSANREAQDLYLRGRLHVNRWTLGEVHAASSCFARAIEIDGSYALAHSGLAESHAILGSWGIDPADHVAACLTSAEHALALDHTLAEPHIWIGALKAYYLWDWPGAEREFRTAIAIDPALPEARYLYAYCCLLRQRRCSEAIAEISIALERDPLSPNAATFLARALLLSGRHDDAIGQLERVLSFDPSFREAHWQLGLVYEQIGRFNEALDAFRYAANLDGRSATSSGTVGHCLARAGHLARARDLLTSDLNPAERALIEVGLGDRSHALDSLERAVGDRHRLVTWLNADPRFSPLHGERRYVALLEAVGLPRLP